ncbi:hypothetical protein Nepgr_025995 [Nepenthes gracilis]|uniref:Uncharacterized protein n=1 Tax=Nepenthes gracilis TaxID=150966 RepID=A0AAD3T8W5_NEPGR|nr:hypothetical protein Nepgr_025995 [Nepenthes gracilis]
MGFEADWAWPTWNIKCRFGLAQELPISTYGRFGLISDFNCRSSWRFGSACSYAELDSRLARLWVVRAILLLRFHLMGPWCFGSAVPASCFMATVVTLVMAVVVQLGSDWLCCKCNCRHFSALLAKLSIAFARFGLWKMAGLGCGWMGLAKVDGDAEVASYRFCLIADSRFTCGCGLRSADSLVLS